MSTERLFHAANPYAMRAFVEASATRRIVASKDIYDDRGIKLWAKSQPVSYSLQQRLLERRLREPIESCLRAEDGVTLSLIRQAAADHLGSTHALARAAQPYADRILSEIGHLPLHAAIQLLLTAVQATKPAVFEHAVRGLVSAGAIRCSQDAPTYDLRLALLGGLMHDVGEMYVNPHYLEGGKRLSLAEYRHVVAHPHIGEVFIRTLTDYPPALATAVGEHHERLDGNGYPVRRKGDALSPLGRLLAATEIALATGEATLAPLIRTSFALRLIPGEFDPVSSGFFASAAQRAGEPVQETSAAAGAELLAEIDRLEFALDAAQGQVEELVVASRSGSALREVVVQAQSLLQRLRASWNAIGLWSATQALESPHSAFELRMAAQELRRRMASLERECLWHRPALDPANEERLQPLWDVLSG